MSVRYVFLWCLFLLMLLPLCAWRQDGRDSIREGDWYAVYYPVALRVAPDFSDESIRHVMLIHEHGLHVIVRKTGAEDSYGGRRGIWAYIELAEEYYDQSGELLPPKTEAWLFMYYDEP